ncbi:aspartyl/asparaginyl beta-hydroxylase domain-containing protein [Kordia sp.]|uniref:aspartyl/asparaginyl beta-hydroxylase domain-containing protein n=1 Tax=Kordia sp. TaxID=1965332 RepID=UPI003D2760C8
MENVQSEYNKLLKAEKIVKANSLVGDHPVFNTDAFAWAKELENNTAVITEEYKNFIKELAVEKLPTLRDLSEDKTEGHDDWRIIGLMAYGETNKKTIDRMPKTFEIISKIPDVITCFFSILSPGKHIKPHRGPYGGVIKCHLPIILPQNGDDYWLKVDGDKHQWKMDEALIFDDSYIHEVHNNTDETRVVLLVEFLRPLPEEIDQLNKAVVKEIRESSQVKIPKKLYEAWEEKELK